MPVAGHGDSPRRITQASKFNRRCRQMHADAQNGFKDRAAFHGIANLENRREPRSFSQEAPVTACRIEEIPLGIGRSDRLF